MKKISAQKAIRTGILLSFIPFTLIFAILIYFLIQHFFNDKTSLSFLVIMLFIFGAFASMIIFANIFKKKWFIWAFNNTFQPSKLKRLSIRYNFLNFKNEYYLKKFESDNSTYGVTMKMIAAINEQVADEDDLLVPEETIIEYDKSRKSEKIIFLLVVAILLAGLLFVFIKKDYLNKGALRTIFFMTTFFLALAYWLLLIKKQNKTYLKCITLNKKGIRLDNKLFLWNEISKATVYISNSNSKTRTRQFRLLIIENINGEISQQNIKLLSVSSIKLEDLMALYKLRSLK